MEEKKNLFQMIEFRRKKKKYFIYELGYPRFNELSMHGIVWNGHYVNYFETARLALCKHYDFDMKQLAELGCYLLVSSYTLNFRGSVFGHDFMKVAVAPLDLNESTMDFVHLLLVGDEIRAYGTLKHVAKSKETGSVFLTMPEELVKVVSPMTKFWDEKVS